MLIPVLHGAATGPFLLAWRFDPLTLVAVISAGWGYGYALDRARRRGRSAPPVWRIVTFYLGLGALALALVGPLDAYNDNLFTMHMLQHIVLMQVAAPLLLLGQPLHLTLKALPAARSGALLRPLLRGYAAHARLHAALPLLALAAYNGVMVVWHIPSLYDAALRHDGVHWSMHLSFFGAGLLFWREIISPLPARRRGQTAWTVLLLGSAMIVGNAVGSIIVFANGVIYPYYASAQRPWGWSALSDQQVAGLVMTSGAGALYTALVFGVLVRALLRQEAEQRRRERIALSRLRASVP